MSILIPQIQAAYERDQQSNFVALTADELPLSFESIDTRWLTAVLCRAAPGSEVVDVQLGPVDSGSSNRRRLQISYNAAGQAAGLPTALFCKASHDLANRLVLGVSGGAFTEVHFYNELRPHLPIEAPVSYHARFDPVSCNSMIMLGDISATVTEFCNHHTDMTIERARSQMRLLGRMHGTSYSHPGLRRELEKLPTWSVYFKNTDGFGMKSGSTNGFMAAEEVIPARLYARHAEVWDKTIGSLDIHTRQPEFLSHGDVHLKNWYVAGNGEMGLSDWQCATRGHWSRDVAYAMATALTVENRRLWDRELIAYYIEELAAAGGPRVSFDEAWDAYRQQLITALTWWTVTLTPPPGLPDMQPRDITMEFIRRISTAMDDHGSLDVVI